MKSKQTLGKKIMGDIRRILIDDWDPNGIKGCGPTDEYDYSIGGLYHLLTQKPSEDEVMDHLYSLEIDETGSTLEDKERLRAVAKKLLKINVVVNA